MEKINVEYLEKCLKILEQSYSMTKNTDENSIEYEMYRNALVKSFEITLEQAGKLLRKRLRPYFVNKQSVDKLNFKSLFREAHNHSLIDEKCVERWLEYRDNRNNTTHDYGLIFAEETLKLMEKFILDVKKLKTILESTEHE